MTRRRLPALLAPLLVAGLALLAPSSPASAASGRGQIYSASALGGSPASYRLVVSSTTNITVGDHVLAQVAGGGSGVWKVTAKTTTTLDVREDLTEQNGGPFGQPLPGAANSFAFATPTVDGYTLLPDGAQFWGAAYRRNVFLGTAAGFVNTSRAINTASPLSGGGNLSADRTLTFATQSANLVLSGPTSGAAALPTFRSLVASDLPNVPVAGGGTGATDATGARTNLGLGTIATQAASSVAITGGSITGITDLAVADGGTGSSTATGARTALGAQAASGRLDDIAAVTPTAGQYLKGNGTNLVMGGLSMTDVTAGTLSAANGGTGFGSGGGSYTQGDTLYAGGASSLSKLALGSAGQCYMVNAGPTGPQWGVLGLAGGGTGQSSLTQGDLLVGANGTAWQRLARGSTGNVLRMASNGLDPEWGTLASTLDNIGSTQGQVLYRSGSAWTSLAAGTAGQYLRTGGAGANPTWSSGLPLQATLAITAGVGAPTDLTGTANGAVITNVGTTVKAACTLPSASAGMSYYFEDIDTDHFRINAFSGDTIRLAHLVSVTSGYVESLTVGASVYLIAIDSTQWIAMPGIVGTWRADSTTSSGFAFSDTPWASDSTTGSWSANTTYTVYTRQIGTELECRLLLTLSGAPTATGLTIEVPGSRVMDTTIMDSSFHPVGRGTFFDSGTGYAEGLSVQATSTDNNTLSVYYASANGNNNMAAVTQAAPGTMSTGDHINLAFSVHLVQ